MKRSNLYDLSTLDGLQAALDGIARSNLPAALKVALRGALDTSSSMSVKRSKGRPPDLDWKQTQKAVKGMLIDRNASRGEQTKEIARLAEEKHISVEAMRDRIFRPNRKRSKP